MDAGTNITGPSNSTKMKAQETVITEEFKVVVAAWVDKVVANEIHEACFPAGMDKYQRKVVAFKLVALPVNL